MRETEILGAGDLRDDGPGRRSGTAAFAVRGQYPMSLIDPRRDDNGLWRATFRVGNAECDPMRVPADYDPATRESTPAHWHTHVVFEGYKFRVRIREGDIWRAEFLDWPQPSDWRATATPEILAEVAAAVEAAKAGAA